MNNFNIHLVKRLHDEVWSQGKIDILDEICSEEFAAYYPNEIWNGLDDAKKVVTEFRTAFPDWNENIDEIIVSEDKIVTRFTSKGTHLGTLFNSILPTGKKVCINEIAIFKIKNGKITEQRGLFDLYNLYKQLGIV